MSNGSTAQASTPSSGASKTPIHEGDRFRSGSGFVYIVVEVGRFGAPCRVVTEDRRCQSLLHHHRLHTMERLS